MWTMETERYERILTEIVNRYDRRSQPVEEPLQPSDFVEHAVADHSQYIDALSEQIRSRICEAAHDALSRLHSGDFGRCVDCGRPISPKRLTAVPWAERCVACQAEKETAAEWAVAA